MDTTDKILERAIETFRARRPVYGRNAYKIGNAMRALFPEGIHLVTMEDQMRYYLLLMVIVKVTRYANNFTKGGHADSTVDAAVYMAMLQSVDEELAGAAND